MVGWWAQGGAVLLGEEKVTRSKGKRRESEGLETTCRLEVCGGRGAGSGHVRFLSTCNGGCIGFVEMLMS